jgi:hypothetical protein
MKSLRRLHLYLGCFFAPLLLFYILTGWYQTVTLDRRKGVGEAETWIERLRSVHVDQIYPTESAMGYSPWLFKWLVVIMAVALTATVILGIVLAFRSIRQRWLVWLSLGLGIVFPMLLLWLGQRR